MFVILFHPLPFFKNINTVECAPEEEESVLRVSVINMFSKMFKVHENLMSTLCDMI